MSYVEVVISLFGNWSQIMEEYRIAVRKDVATNLKLPSKCSCCLEPTTSSHHMIVKHKALKGYELKVPYCETHARMLHYLKIIERVAIGVGAVVGLPLAVYFQKNRVVELPIRGLNASIGIFIGIAGGIALLVIFQLGALFVFFPGKRYVSRDGAVQIVEVYPDAFVLLFDNKVFGLEFSVLNYSLLSVRNNS